MWLEEYQIRHLQSVQQVGRTQQENFSEIPPIAFLTLAGDAAAEGPWTVLPSPSGDWPEWQEVHGLWRPCKRPDRSDPTEFLASGQPLALYSSLARPIIGRDPLYVLGQETWRGGYPSSARDGPRRGWRSSTPSGRSPPPFSASVGQRPYDVAVFLEAMGPSCRMQAGAFLHRRLTVSRD